MERGRKTPEEVEDEARYGMKLSDLTEEAYDDLIGIYEQVTSIRKQDDDMWDIDRSLELYDIRDTLQSGDDVQYRLGSRISRDSKLWIKTESSIENVGERVIAFSFDSNVTNPDERAKKMELDFRNKVHAYLLQHNLAIPIGK